MVVKILSSAGTFSGVEYNENKVNAGSAYLLGMENFGLIDADAKTRSVHELQQYFKAWSTDVRGMISKPQFHVAISCKGREYNAEQLKCIAEQYIEKMGYKENPYLIYFHSDTANNHIHIVTSRVNEYGLKVNDSFERRRSQTAMSEILGLDTGRQVSDEVNKAMTYNFSSEAQFKMILEGKGITVNAKGDQYQFIRAGGVAYEIDKQLVADKIKLYQDPAARIAQLKALFAKYKPALTAEKFADLMKEKFSVEIAFHTAKEKEAPYGYSIIDHAKRQVLKGSQVMKLSDLLTLAPRPDMLKAGAELISSLAEDQQLRYRDFKGKLSKLGFELNPAGQVKLSGEDNISFNISKERMKQVMYNDRLSEAQKFTINTAAESEIIRKVMHLKKEHTPLPGHQGTGTKPGPEQEQARAVLSDKLNSLLATGKELGDIAKENNYTYARNAGEVYLVDQKNYALHNMAGLTNHKLDFSGAQVIDTDRPGREMAPSGIEQSTGTFAEFAGQLLAILEAGVDESEKQEQNKKRKRRME
jgi:hypothetical protein